jgi:hypothetical protein
MKSLILLAIMVVLSGCNPQTSASDKLKSCLVSTEQTILLRQMTASTKTKEAFEVCRQSNDESYCRGLYFDANRVVRQCMKEAGYSFIDMDFYSSRKENPYSKGDIWHGGELRKGVCEWEGYKNPECYQPTLWFKLTNWWWAFREGEG